MLIYFIQTESPFILAFLIVPITISIILILVTALFLIKKYQAGQAKLRGRQNNDTALSTPAPYADHLERANTYRRQIITLIKEKTGNKKNALLTAFIPQVETWAKQVQKLVKRLQAYQADGLLQEDTHTLPQTLARLEEEHQAETDPVLQNQLQKTMAEHQRQHDHLQQLASLMRRTELELEQTLAAMGSIYAQLQLLQGLDIDSTRAKNLAEGLDGTSETA